MNDLIYYPGFEIADQRCLKFALLYLDCIRPIIPLWVRHGTKYISDSFRRVMDETNLIYPYCPDSDEGSIASIQACEEIEKILSAPDRYVECFHYSNGNDMLDKWRDPRYQDTTLFRDKFSGTLFRFCVENKIATPCNEGIKISKELSFVYMSLLANVISREDELELFTDNRTYSLISIKNELNVAKKLKKNLEVGCSNIEFVLPRNLDDIQLEEIIKLRKQSGFNDARKAFLKEIEKLIEYQENGRLDYSLEEFLSIKKDLLNAMPKAFLMLAAVTLSVFSFSSFDDGLSGRNMIAATANAGVNVGSAYAAWHDMRNSIDEQKQKHLARKYLATIRKNL